jgi:hypothetical protein
MPAQRGVGATLSKICAARSALWVKCFLDVKTYSTLRAQYATRCELKESWQKPITRGGVPGAVCGGRQEPECLSTCNEMGMLCFGPERPSGSVVSRSSLPKIIALKSIAHVF